MRRLILLPPLVLLLLDPPVAAAQSQPAPVRDHRAIAAWDSHLDSLARADAFSGAVLVAQDDQVLWRAAYGYASRPDKLPNRTETRFNLGSINKLFTKLAIAQLVDQGKVDLDATIDRYLPDYPKAVARRVTVRHLLGHRGGVGDIFGPSYDGTDRSKLRRVADWIPLFRDKPLAFEPGTDQEYSNGGYVLLGAIVEKAAGQDYYEYIRRHVYEPLGMSRTDHYAEDARTPDLARGYTHRLERGREASEWSDNGPSRPLRGSPAGGGYSTLDDLLRFTRAIRSGSLVSGRNAGDFRELAPGPGGEIGVGMGGGAPGINAMIEMNGPYTVIVLANLDPPAAQQAAAKILEWLPGGGGEGRRVIRHRPGEGGGASGTPSPERRLERRVAHDSPAVERSHIPAAGVEVEMSRVRHLPAVQVKINGQGPFLFAIDTGAHGAARLDSAVAARLGLEKVGEIRAGDPSGRNSRVMPQVRVGTIEIGGARFEGMNAAVRDFQERRLGLAIDGILGFGLFRDCLLTLDYPAQKVRIEQGALPPANGADVLDFTTDHGIPLVRLQVASLVVDAHVDAGAQGGFSLPAELMSRLSLAAPARVVGRARTISNEFEIQGADLVGTVRLGGFEFPRATVEFQPLFPMANVGARVLDDFRVTFDQKNRRLRLRRPS